MTSRKKIYEHLLHGGDILSASKATGIPIEDWIDLSTGISPYAYPCQRIPEQAFSNLPYIDQHFKTHATRYYGSEQFAALPGTQAAIQLLPSLLDTLPILLPSLGYQEHRQAWEMSGNQLNYYTAFDAEAAVQDIDLALTKEPQHLLIINPNNPSTLCFSPQQLITWSQRLAKGAYLIVDEAFIDTSPEQSLVPFLSDLVLENIIILRSFGKFFGLAGIRLGFVFAAKKILSLIEEILPLWVINGPALYLASKAFSDHAWQAEHHKKLANSERVTRYLFSDLDCELCLHQPLFSSYILSKELALTIFKLLYNKGILIRLITIDQKKSILRIGRVKSEDVKTITLLRAALNDCMNTQTPHS